MSESEPRPQPFLQECLRNKKFADFYRLYERATKFRNKLRDMLQPGEQMKMKDKLKCKILQNQAKAAFAEIPDDAITNDEALTFALTLLEILEDMEVGLRITFDEETMEYEEDDGLPTSAEYEPDEDDDFNEADHEHENGKVREFMTAYKKARQEYFRAVFQLDPGKDMSPKTMVDLATEFTIAESLYENIPPVIRKELRTKATAGQAYAELGIFFRCLQEFYESHLDNEVDVE